MARVTWDKADEREFETGVSHGMLYIPTAAGLYTTGVPWNGLTTVTESPSGAEASKQYADNMVYLNLTSAETFGATIEAFMCPEEFGQFDGFAEPEPGVLLGQQTRGYFGLSYQSIMGNALNSEVGYKIHLVWGAQAAPSEKAHATVNDSPEATTFSWDLTTTPVAVGTIAGKTYKPTSTITVKSTTADPAGLADLEDLLYGTDGTPGSEPSLPTPAAVVALFAGA